MYDETLRYDPRSIHLHWITAVLVAALWTLGQCIDFFPKGLPRVSARSTHILLGLILAFVVVLRIRWRFGGGGVQLPSAGDGRLDRLATLVHSMLYMLLVLTVLLGIANAWLRGDSLFGLLSIPRLAPDNQALKRAVQEWHGLSANTIAFLAGLHAAAGLWHHYVRRDDVLRRMS